MLLMFVLLGRQLLAGCMALGKDGTIVFFRDVLQDRRPVTIRFDDIRGVAYRL